jgi:hypothetical protein
MKQTIVSLCLLLVCGTVLAADKLDDVKLNSKLINELKDVYRAFNINHKISDQTEMLALLTDGDQEEMKSAIRGYIAVNTKITTACFADKLLKAHVDSFLSLIRKRYDILLTKGLSSQEFQDLKGRYDGVYDRYMNYMMTRYALDHFIKLTEEDFWKRVDKKNFAKAPEFDKFTATEKADVPGSKGIIEQLIATTPDLQERVIYKLALADQFVKYDTIDLTASDSAIRIYKSILDEKKYCLYLFEAWAKWRMVSQYQGGMSVSSDIPNATYDGLRMQEAYVILDHISKHPADDLAINQFLLVATHDIIRRYGDYPYGNQNTIEYHETFDDPK